MIYQIFYLKLPIKGLFRKESECFYTSMMEVSRVRVNQEQKLKALIEKYEKELDIHQKKQAVLAPIYLQIFIFVSLYSLCGLYRSTSGHKFNEMDVMSLILVALGVILSLWLSKSEIRSIWDKF